MFKNYILIKKKIGVIITLEMPIFLITKKGIKFLLKKNYFVIRIGRGSEKKLYFKDKNYLDYSNLNIKNDFLDIG